jgi:hypothetical protein
MGVIKDVNRYWQTKDPESGMRVYAAMEGRITLGEFLTYMAENHPHIDPNSVNLNWGTATWEDRPTEEEVAERERQRRWSQSRHDAWERRTWEKLKAKYINGITPSHAPWSEAQVASLNAFQKDGNLHPFTCPREHSDDVSAKLIATEAGWLCEAPGCLYTQDWAHPFMVEWV